MELEKQIEVGRGMTSVAYDLEGLWAQKVSIKGTRESKQARSVSSESLVMVVLHDVGPAADFGSLGAFLGVERPRRRETAESRPPESTLLNKKVAFRMLKQLGCEVQRDESSCCIEVSLSEQPVLFKMLVELGHGPKRNEAGDLMVQVKEPRPRNPEQLVAALTARKAKVDPNEGYPCIGRPRLRPEDEQELVKRLYKAPTKPQLVEPEVAKPRRTAAEQRAYLDRLLKPNKEPFDLELKSMASRLTLPSFSAPWTLAALASKTLRSFLRSPASGPRATAR